MWLTVAALVPACATPPRGAHQTPPPLPGANELRQRADQLWRARVAEDWAITYRFEDPLLHEKAGVEEYATWCRENEPFVTKTYQLGQVHTDQDLGWVEVSSSTALRRFPDLPARDVQRWEKWRIVDGQWYPVPRTEINNYPEAPALRDATAEAQLASRFAVAWRARQEKDWPARYALLVPSQRDRITVEELVKDEDRFEYLNARVLWVQVIGDRGLVRARYEFKQNDPSLTKMAPEVVDLIEHWVRSEGEWYRELGAKSQ
jgi:hypothetical protein